MGEHFSIDVTDVHLFHGYEWWPLEEPCPHEGPFFSQSVIAWGPTTATYELIERECGCRAWKDGRWTQERQRESGLHGFWVQRMVWYRPPDGGAS